MVGLNLLSCLSFEDPKITFPILENIIVLYHNSIYLLHLNGIFKTFKISIETIYQDLQKGNQVANLIIFTHTVKRTQMEKAVLKINKLKGTVGNALAFCIYN